MKHLVAFPVLTALWLIALAAPLAAQVEPDEICPAEWIAPGGFEGAGGSGCGDFQLISWVADVIDGACGIASPCKILEPAYAHIKYTGSLSLSLVEIVFPGSVHPPAVPDANGVFAVRFYGEAQCNQEGDSLQIDIVASLYVMGGPHEVCRAWNTLVCNQCQLPPE